MVQQISKWSVFVMVFNLWVISADAQLQITEVMYDTTADEGSWEWIEIVNSSGDTIDLDGYVFDDFSLSHNALTSPNIYSDSEGGVNQSTEVSPGETAVLYNGDKLDFEEHRFRNAWQLPPTVTLLGVSRFQSLNNSGDTIGIWESLDDYQLDLANTDDDEQLEVDNFTSALAWLDYAAEGFPNAKHASIEWTGEGSYQDGANWRVNSEETEGVLASVETFLPTAPINSERDIASPGVALGEGAPTGLVITELMYNPASSEPTEWEWVEVLNATGQDLDFATTPYFFDDVASAPLVEANVNTGSVGNGEVAILFSDAISLENMRNAWGDDVNYIPVDHWSAMNNGGDTIGIWSSEDSYRLDNPVEGNRSFAEAEATVSYDDGANDWPNVADGQSISLQARDAESQDPTNWIASSVEDGVSRMPNVVHSSTLLDHAGGDLGTPGSFGDTVFAPTKFDFDVNSDGVIDATDSVQLCDAAANAGISLADELEAEDRLPGDADLNGMVDFSDFLLLSSNFGAESHYGGGDFDCNGSVNFTDFLVLSANFGETATVATVPEPRGRQLLPVATMLFLGLMLRGRSTRKRSEL